jgi:hypothetical protein
MLQKYKNLSIDRQMQIKVGTGLTIAAIVIFCGFGESHATVTGCMAQVKSYQTAYFEEDYITVCTSTDADGNLVTETCTETSYWEKPASQVFSATTHNGNLSSESHTDLASFLNQGFYTVPTPEIERVVPWSSNDEYHFEYYRATHNTTHTVLMLREDESDNVTKDPSFYLVCENYREQGNSIKVKTWYNISYNVEGFSG